MQVFVWTRIFVSLGYIPRSGETLYFAVFFHFSLEAGGDAFLGDADSGLERALNRRQDCGSEFQVCPLLVVY